MSKKNTQPKEWEVLKTERELEKLIRQAMIDFGVDPDKPFEPCALYFKDSDRILVLTRDCSKTEYTKNNNLYVYKDNYPDESEDIWVGFAVEPALAICRHNGLAFEDTLNLEDLLNLLEKLFREISSDALGHLQIARRIIREFNIKEVKIKTD
jgi:hypothetical protein